MHAGVLPLNRANLVAAGPLLEAPPLGPDDQGLLLLLVCGVRLDLGLKQRIRDEWRDKLRRSLIWPFTVNIFKTQ